MSQQIIKRPNKDVKALLNSDDFLKKAMNVLPKFLTPKRLVSVAINACQKNPKLYECTQESLFSSIITCATAGLEPDGRLAHLIPYGNQCQVIFDWKGLVTLAARNNISVYADMVCENDDFSAAVVNGLKVINHQVNWKKERGEVYAYYCVTNIKGVIDYEVMSFAEVQEVRKMSRAANSGPWVTHPHEMGKKSVVRRMSKRWELLPEIRDVINADDDTPAIDVSGVVIKPPKMDQPTDGAVDIDNPPEAPAEPEPPKPVDEPPKEGLTLIQHVRNLLKAGNITEKEAILFLYNDNRVPGDDATLEWVEQNVPEQLAFLRDNISTLRKTKTKGQK